MWKSDDEESNLLESVVNWAAPTPPTPVRTTGSNITSNTSTSIPCVQTPPLPPPSPFSELFPQELLQSSGLLLSQFDDVINSTVDHNETDNGIDDDRNFRHPDEIHHEPERNSDPVSNLVRPRTQSANPINPGSMYRCAECKFSTDDRRLFMCHKRSKHAGEKSFSCPDCSAKFTRQYSLKKHVLQKHPAMCPNPASQLPKYCPFPNCKYATRNLTSMQLHKRIHQQLYFCKECNARYTRRQSLLGHLTKHHGSNAALIGMRPSPAVSVIDDQSLQSPPPSSTAVSSASAPFFQQQPCSVVIEAESPPSHDDDQEESQSASASAFPAEETAVVSSGVSQFNSSDAATESINAVVGSVAGSSHGPLDTRFYCDKCNFTTNSLRQLYGHKLSSHRGAKEKLMAKTSHQICPHCPRKFDSLKRMLAHVKTHTTAVKTRGKKSSKNGGKQRRQYTKRRPQPLSMSCERCDFTSSRKRVFAAHVKSHATESLERNQDLKHESSQSRKHNPAVSKRFTPDRVLLDSISSAANPIVNSPSYASAVSPSAYDFYHTGAGPRHNGSGAASTHSSGSIQDLSTPNGGNFGQFFVVNRNSSTSSSNSFASDHSSSNRLIRLDLNNQNTSGFDEMAACLQGLQQANGALMQLLRRRENELRSIRSNVVELLRSLLPNNPAFHHTLTLENVDEVVTNTLNRVLQEAAAQK